MMAAWRALAAGLLALALCGCVGLGPAQRARVETLVQDGRSDASTCTAADACAQHSPLHQLAAEAFAESSSAGTPRHRALILDDGGDALLARINLIRSATTRIDLQTYIFDEDDAGRLVLDELLAAAKRGVRVRVLIDQLSALERVQTLAALAGAHRNLELRVYNPVLARARISYPMYVLASACCWRKLNQRMHSKLLLVDGAIGITGGRNYQDDYYDWDASYNFRDRDLLVAGPVARDMAANFVAFWDSPRSVPVEQLADVGGLLLDEGIPPLPRAQFEAPRRIAQLSADAADPERAARLAAHALDVGEVRFIADLPDKSNEGGGSASTDGLRELIEQSQYEVLLQTPYLVLSKPAQQLFRELHARPRPPRVLISTNSLAATDSFIAYALSYKYKRRYLRDFGFEIHEIKPFPETVPASLLGDEAAPQAATGQATPLAEAADDAGKRPIPLTREYSALRYAGVGVNERLPLVREGPRRGMHAKSMVIDQRIGVVGTHNFDPRGEHYNTESALVIDDPAFAQALEASIRGDMTPGNAWVIARRPHPPVFSGLEYSLAKVSEQLPIFDLWPVRYATSYEFEPGPDCPQPLSPFDDRFQSCYRPVGDFPEVAIGLKSILTRIFTAFGAGLAPIL